MIQQIKIKEFVKKADDPRLIPIYHEENIGFVAGLLDAISKARGEYIAIQGSGDVSMPARIEKQKNLLDAHPEVGIVGCHYENYVQTSGVVRKRTPNANDTTLGSLLDQNVFTHGEVMFRKSTYEKAGGYRPQFTFCQDYDLWLRMIRHAVFPQFRSSYTGVTSILKAFPTSRKNSLPKRGLKSWQNS